VENEEIEEKVFHWIVSMRARHLRITRKSISRTALNFAGVSSTFKASNGWIDNFLKRYSLSLRRKTHVSQRVPEDVENRVVSFFNDEITEQWLNYVYSDTSFVKRLLIFYSYRCHKSVATKNS